MYNNLLAYINSRLPDNITKLITPAKMRQNFAEAIDQLGQDANFMGIVTPSDTIAATEVKQFYVAVPTGISRTFTNFGGTITVPAYQGCLFYYDNDAWGYTLVNFDAVLQVPNYTTDDDLPVIFQETPKILNANKTAHVEYSGDLTFNPSQKILTAGYFKGDGSMLSNLPQQCKTYITPCGTLYPVDGVATWTINHNLYSFGLVISVRKFNTTTWTTAMNLEGGEQIKCRARQQDVNTLIIELNSTTTIDAFSLRATIIAI